MNLEQALAKVERENKMWGGIVAPIRDSLAKQEADIREKVKNGERLDDMERAVAYSRGIVK